ncbi:aldehyde dehydrogenase [Streptomyces malaysiensis]|uniref:NAD-dependent aldehyde dehydrogenase n=1 Tax=Streptomyces malaysiensis TaxID=92644 RepID=A0A7X5WWF8_STRMQ|nr:aldehyde dehydrogenase [Streptomyces malaysiensis]NIY62265.1 NAD-dependent aldehyde dehydrogenase [Streptomyces malaysiensis]
MSDPQPKFITEPFIDGKIVSSLTNETFDSVNPATGQVIASVAACGQADVDAAVASARAAFDSGVWSRATPAERKAVLLRFADLLDEHIDELAALDSIDAGKPITDTRTLDLPDAIGTIRWYAESIDKVFGHISPTGPGNLGLITREPVGVVAGVLPWNFPMATLSWKIGPALAAGNSVVIKPAELSPFSTLRTAELAAEAGLPAGVFNVVPGLGHVTGKALGLHPDVDIVTFTGSTEVGRHFLRYSADSNLKKIVLECGGKSPQLVLADQGGKLAGIAEELAGAAFWNMGENCTCGSRILVHRSLRDELVSELVVQAATWTVGDPQHPDTKIGAMIEEAHLRKVMGYIEAGVAAGATVATGGNQVRQDSGGWFVEPTVFTDVTPEMSIAREEIFGPVLSVIAFDTEEEAIRIANDSPYGLAASVFTDDLNAAHRTAGALKAGTVSVNCYSEGDVTTPFGGFKMSGFGGHDKGIEAFDQYTELKTTWFALN